MWAGSSIVGPCGNTRTGIFSERGLIRDTMKTDRYATIGDLTIRYWEEGAGSPLLLIHGLGASVETWAWNIEALAQDYRVIALDLPGFGESSRPTRNDFYSLEYAGSFLRQFVNALGYVDKLSVAGNSMGGILAIQLSLMYPEMVEKLVLVDSAGLNRTIHWATRLMSVWPVGELLMRPARRKVQKIARSLFYRDELITDEFVDRMLEMLSRPGAQEIILKSLRSGVNVFGQFLVLSESRLRQVMAPTLVIWGEEDALFPIGHAEFALRAIPDCRAVVLEEAGHMPQMDRPDAFNRLTAEFLETGRLSVESTETRLPIYV